MLGLYMTVGSIAVTLMILVWVLSKGGGQSVLRAKYDVARLAVQLVAAFAIPLAAGIITAASMAAGAALFGGAIGLVQGRNLRVSASGPEVVVERNRLGLIVWTVGVVTMQTAGLANRVGILEVGQGVSWFSIGVGFGLLVARQSLVRDATGPASFAGLVAVVLGLAGPLTSNLGLLNGATADSVAPVFESDETDESDGTEEPEETDATKIELGTGGVQVTLSWNGDADMDLHVIDTVGFEIYYSSLVSPQTGGELDEDDRPACGSPAQEVENVFWAPAATPAGEYVAFVRSFRGCADRPQAYVVEVRVDDVLVARDHGSLFSGQDSIQISFSVRSNGATTELEEIGGGEDLDIDPEDVTGTGTYVTPVDSDGSVRDSAGSITNDEALAASVAGLIAAALAGVITWAEAVIGSDALLVASGRAPQGEQLVVDSVGVWIWGSDGAQTNPPPTPPPPPPPAHLPPPPTAQQPPPPVQAVSPPPQAVPPVQPEVLAQPVPPTAPTPPVHPAARGVQGPTSTPQQPQSERRTKDELWETAQQKLNSKGSNPTMDSSEFIEYLRRLEAEFPSATPQQLIAALHASEYAADIDRTVPMFDGSLTGQPWSLFKHGPETGGYEAVHARLEAGNSHEDKFTMKAPKFVIGPDGKSIDIDHVWAGLRSDLNRQPGEFAQLMKLMNTDWGDEWQTWMHWDEGKAPPPQRKGNLIGRVMASDRQDYGKYDRPLSEAFTEWFNLHG